jgi:penicillin-binding protein 2
LWSLQILNVEQLLRAAQNNQRREVRLPAPRGAIVDRNGLPLVTNVPGTIVQIDQASMPKRRSIRLREIRRRARVLKMPAREIGGNLRRHRQRPAHAGHDQVRRDRDPHAQAGYLTERADDFPG